MKIISVRKGFTADHSSTSYEFLAIDRPLDPQARSAVASLSRRARPTSRRVSFVYNVDGYDIPGGWEALMEKYYDVMYMESYGWWLLAMAFNASPGQRQALKEYAFDGVEDLGVEILTRGNRVIVAIHCQLEEGFAPDEGWEAYDEDPDEEEEEGNGEDGDEDEDHGESVARNKAEQVVVVETDNYLLNLLGQIRRQLMAGDYRALYAVWEKYRYYDDEEGESEDEAEGEKEEGPPVPPEKETGKQVISALRDLLVVP
ncbi:MAG: hypothetical protein HPY52_09605 [Firmicutes bacterium]|nr:hypothetical protein [Bacillota bacterium]